MFVESEGRQGGPKWHHLGQANNSGVPPDSKSKQSRGANPSLYKHWVGGSRRKNEWLFLVKAGLSRKKKLREYNLWAIYKKQITLTEGEGSVQLTSL